MTKDRVKRKQKQNNDSAAALYAAGFFLLAGIIFAVALFSDANSAIFGFVAKCQSYLLGKGAFLLSVTCFLLSWKLYWDGKITLLQKKTLAFILVMLCLFGTAHHVFVAVNEELTPHLLPNGGGLIGGLLVLPLHRSLGVIGTWLVLAFGWLASIWLLFPVSTIWNWLSGLIADITGSSDEIDVRQLEQEQKVKPQKSAGSQIIPNKNKAVANNSIRSIYRSGEFGTFTDGIEKKSSIKSILGVKNNPYDEEPIKQELEHDPIQVPEWQSVSAKENKVVVPVPEWKSSVKENNVVLRPVINYDNGDVATPMPEHRFLDGSAPAPEAERPVIQEAPSIIHNEYRERLKEEVTAEKIAQVATEKNAVTISDVEQPEERKIAIYDSADKVQEAVSETKAATEPAVEETAANNEDNEDNNEENENLEANAYQLPPLELLDMPRVSDPMSYQKDIMEQCAVLEQTLADFRVRAKVIAVTRGPSVTRFELEPAPGVKVSSVVNLADDIALRLAAPGVRIEAPIPGKSAIGIEAPNIKNDTVCFREVVDTATVRNAASRLCIGLGKDISGEIISADLAKMPHLLVAGSTGSGKSVCINTIIAGILYKARPEEVKLILVDPKVVELSNYNGIPHLLTPVVTEPKKAASALHWAVAEMERRYKLFADNHVREINSYNAQTTEKMPFIVIIIDELSDLMMVAKVDVEDAILRLAQKARAAGIHLILATQRPSVDVITGIVKANIPSRIAFAVSSQTDSRTIIDMGGAEKLLGKGDMLFYPIGFNKPVRVQGAFVTDDELNKIVQFIVQQSIPVNYTEEVTQQELECDSKNKNNSSEEAGSDLSAEDELFPDALSLVLDMGQASASMLQRRFRIGYTRAARLVDNMEELGIVGQSVGSKPREVIMSRQEAEERFLKA